MTRGNNESPFKRKDVFEEEGESGEKDRFNGSDGGKALSVVTSGASPRMSLCLFDRSEW